MSEWKRIGTCGVDSGQMMLIDPCYVLPNERDGVRITYEELLALYKDDFNRHVLDVRGLGFVTSTGFGDGSYDVFIKESDEGDWGKRVAALKIVFIED